jgi:undecaprenyl-diphosphatase
MADEAAGDPAGEARGVARLLRRHGWRLVLLFAGLLLPLGGFAELADDVMDGEPFAFDEPILLFAQEAAGAGLDRFFLLASKLGYEWGVVPADILLVLGLVLAGRHRKALFAGVALAGSGLLNVVAKQTFARDRPSLWESIAPEQNFSFPSGHAMGSMTLATVVVLLCWQTRWRWPVLGAALVFVPMVGLSRVYLGVHYPSDILAGWAAALAWTVAVWMLVGSRWRRAAIR